MCDLGLEHFYFEIGLRNSIKMYAAGYIANVWLRFRVLSYFFKQDKKEKIIFMSPSTCLDGYLSSLQTSMNEVSIFLDFTTVT